MANDIYEKTIARMEPDIACIDSSAGWSSIAISLKRIADALEFAALPERFPPDEPADKPLPPIVGTTEDRTIEPREPTYPRIQVTGGDYTYWGYLNSVFHKLRGGHIRAVVEDENGRLFIHNAGQLQLTDNELLELGVKYKLIVA